MHAVAAISQSALAHNLSIVRAQAPHSKIVGMVKANAYGHHLTHSTPLLQADLLGVSELSEARQLRQLCNQPILLLPGVYNATELNEAIELGCHVVIHHPSQITAIANVDQTLNVWLKVDTGMHRLGLSADELNLSIQQLAKNPNIHIEAVMSHFACADEPNNIQNLQQISHFDQLDITSFNRSMANSAAILSLPNIHFDYVRPGIMLYGVSPFGKPHESLQPVMELSAPILSLKKISAGERVGYGATWQAEEDTTIAVIGIGYGDGYPRHARNGTPILINNKLYPLAGRVSMDLICVDIGNASVNIGDKAILWGHAKLRVETIAQYSDTIGYELLTHVSSRVNFIQS